ncbi:MAG: membrane-bound O-acyltransferase family protein [Flavobacteriales bacterium]|nr:membrane-bound O-acyltransferase family protein [Flavobacteriales bacterium]|tara:strand:- start:437 stop:1879 length:1443 start_codon:yes stop_codon:yes gene_type:complete
MIFNSIEFAIFLPIVFLLYWTGKRYIPKSQNYVLLVASYFFYGWWDYRFLALIFASSLVDYIVARRILHSESKKKKNSLLCLSLLMNLGMLAYFKYANFFIDSFIDSFSLIGFNFNVDSLELILPVGISFYTFQTLSYTIDVWKGQLRPINDAVAFFSFVSFFPQLVAGPIERAENLLPQFLEDKKFNYNDSAEGLKQILWGLFKKVVIADNCAYYANQIFESYGDHSGGVLLLGGVLFAFQIYGDFSGYSDIAIGTSKLFGFHLKINFNFPYFSKGISEFWKRWHISLSTWFRDYVYIPLGGSKNGRWVHIRNIMIVFLVSGLWHGANWTFVVWGAFHGLLFIPAMYLRGSALETALNKTFIIRTFRNSVVFLLVTLLWVFFRSQNVGDAFQYLGKIFDLNGKWIKDLYNYLYWNDMLEICILLFVFILIEYIQQGRQIVLQFKFLDKYAFIRWTLYYSVLFCILLLGAKQQDFIYFQF